MDATGVIFVIFRAVRRSDIAARCHQAGTALSRSSRASAAAGLARNIYGFAGYLARTASAKSSPKAISGISKIERSPLQFIYTSVASGDLARATYSGIFTDKGSQKMDMGNMKPKGLRGTPARGKRAAMLLEVKCTKAGQEPVTLRVRNLSETGLGGVLKKHVVFATEEPVALAFKNFGSVAARVVWVEGDKIGFAFDQPIELQRINCAREWNGPGFDIADKHIVANKCWRPGLGS
jgi:hypothetical protein